MAKPEKQIAINTFIGGKDSDTSDQLLNANKYRRMLNARVYSTGTDGVADKVKGNTLIPNILPAGNNKGHGYGRREENGKLYFINFNDQDYHGIYAYDIITQAITPVLLNITDTNGVDIMKLDVNYPVYHFDIVANTLAYWVDGLNKARKTDFSKCIDKTSTGYGTVITEDFITAYKRTGVYAATVEYFTDLTRTSNYLYALQFKFTYRFYYDNGEMSHCADFSAVAYPPNESYLGASAITFANNGIYVTVETGNKLVTKIEILVQIDDAPFTSCIVLNKSQLNIADYGNYTWQFFNDGAYIAVEQLEVLKPYSYLPPKPKAQAFLKKAMGYGNFNEGFPTIQVNADVSVTYTPFYLPSGTVSQLNDPDVIITLLSTDEHGGLFNSWFTTISHFIIGEDVKKGNVFTINSYGGNISRLPSTTILRTFTITANGTDTATTIASAIKQWLRSIDAVGTGAVSNEATDGSGNVSWDFTIEAHEGKNAITFNGSVTPINYSTLLDNGLSLNTIKQGSTRKYAIVYDDDDGVTTLAYTSDSLLVKTQYETETLLGDTVPLGLQQPTHTISIRHSPPLWAKYWRLVRTKDTDIFIQLLIQQLNTVVVANEDTYLDLVVGSLFTYQKIHPDTILQYEFQRGDRLRLISNETTTPPTLYTPYYETEVLSYSTNTEEFVDANVTIDGTNVVVVGKAVNDNYKGKYIIINGTERLITSVSGTSLTLDFDVTPNLNYASGSPTTTTYPNYTYKDIRGIIRIKLPPPAYDFSIPDLQILVEVYRPQQNIDNTSYLNFLDFQQKFEISNWGTVNASHIGNVQNQDPENPATIPAIVSVTQGDAYVRNRAMPSNNQDPNPQVIIDQICDPNFSDFYKSNLYSTGRTYPQDQAFGVVKFGSRVRWSTNFIEDTRINGLNNFNNTDREDYNDAYGDITLLRFRKGYLRVFKQLRTAWTPVGQRIIKDNAGNELLTTSDKLLNELIYSEWEGGIGDNPESYFENGSSEYIASTNSGVFLRIAQDGSIPISSVYFCDKDTRDLLSQVSKYNLKIPGGFDRKNNEGIWSVSDYIQYIFNNNFNAGDWKTILDAYPSDTTWTITQQPANSTATVVGSLIEITGTSTLGSDFFKFRGNLSAGGTTPVINFCFTVVQPPFRQTAFRAKASTLYCFQGTFGNTGQQGWDVLEEYYIDDNSLTGRIMPNVNYISSSAIVPTGTTITFNHDTNPTPTGGSDGDIWNNDPLANLYKKVAGVWSLLTDKALNASFQAPITNTTACPITPPTPGTDNFTLSAQYGYTITNVRNGLGTTGVPAAFATIAVTPGTNLSAAYTTVTIGSIGFDISGTPVLPGLKMNLYIDGVVISTVMIPMSGSYALNFPVTQNDPTVILMSIDS